MEMLLIILLITLSVSLVFRWIGLPVILGYLVVGTIVGPHMLGILPDVAELKEFAEIGVAFLMFTIGLEFNLSKLWALRYSVFLLGGMQVLGTIAATMLVGYWLHIPVVQLIVMGCIGAMSSTAIVVKQLAEQAELHSAHGNRVIGILLFQDLAVIPILVLIGSFAGSGLHVTLSFIGLAILKGCAAVLIIIALSRYAIRPLFHVIAASKVTELFTLSTLLVVLGAAWVTQQTGLSYALGAFLAGIMLGDTEFRHQTEAEIRPFKDVLLGVFFLSIGMLVNIVEWAHTWEWIALMLCALMVGKSVLIVLLCKLLRGDTTTALRTGIILSQGGEFGFAVLTLALHNQLLPADYGQVILAALLIAFGLAPIIIRFNSTIADFFAKNHGIAK